MWIRAAGSISENVIHLTTPVSSHFLVASDLCCLVDTSSSSGAREILESLESLGLDGERFRFVAATNSGFQFIGGYPFLKRAFPDLELLVSTAISETLAEEAVLVHHYEVNKAACEAMSRPFDMGVEEWLESFKSQRVIGDGDALVVGEEVEVKLVTTPGYTADSCCYYIKSDSAVAAGASLGDYGGRGKISPSFGASYSSYVKSLDRISSLDVRSIGFFYSGVVTGDLALRYLVEARVEAERVFTSIKERLEQGELIEEVASTLVPQWTQDNVWPDGPFVDSQRGLLRELVKSVAENR